MIIVDVLVSCCECGVYLYMHRQQVDDGKDEIKTMTMEPYNINGQLVWPTNTSHYMGPTFCMDCYLISETERKLGEVSDR